MATTYFGYCDAEGTGTGVTLLEGRTSHLFRNEVAVTCPGSGSQNVKELGVEVSVFDNNACNYIVGVYLVNALVVETSSEKSGDGVWITWNDTEITWRNGNTVLTGGVDYKLALGSDATSYMLGTAGLDSGTSQYLNYAASLTDPWASGTNYTDSFNLRCGVEPAAAGGVSIPIVMQYYQRLRARGLS